jgi:hypothetical protein
MRKFFCGICDKPFEGLPTYKATLSQGDGIEVQVLNVCGACAGQLVDEKGEIELRFSLGKPNTTRYSGKHGREFLGAAPVD